MAEQLFSKTLDGGTRTYFFDVKKTDKSKYLALTESHKDQEQKFVRNTFLVFPDRRDSFISSLQEASTELKK